MVPRLTVQIALSSLILVLLHVTMDGMPSRICDIELLPDAQQNLARFHATVTAYSSSPDETWGDPFITASGRRVFDGLVACPRAFPFGTQFRIGSRTYTCWDRLHQKYDDRIDIWMSSKDAALEFGRQRLLIEVL